MKINDAGLALIKSFEGLRLKSYQDQGGIWTIGYGHTSHVVENMSITQSLADDLLANDLELFEQSVFDLLTVDVTENEFSAMVCLTFNIGIHNFKDSTLLKLVNNGQFSAAANEFIRWNRVNHIVNKGLTRRRKAEMALFLA